MCAHKRTVKQKRRAKIQKDKRETDRTILIIKISKSHYLQEKSSIFLLFTPKIDVNFFFGAPGEVHQNTPTFIFWTSPLGQWGRGFSVLSTPHAGSSFTLLNDPTNRIFWRPLLETKPPAPLASFLAAAHARIIAAEGSAALSRGSRGPRERAKVPLSPRCDFGHCYLN